MFNKLSSNCSHRHYILLLWNFLSISTCVFSFCVKLYQMLAELLSRSVSVVCVCLSLPIRKSPELSFYYCLQTSSFSMSICIQRSPKLTLVVRSKCSTLQAHSFVYLYQMSASWASLSLSFSQVCVCFYLYQMLAELLSIIISFSVFCFHLCLSFSIQRSLEHSWTLFLLLSPKLFSLFVKFCSSFSSISLITLNCQIYCQRLLLLRHVSASMSTSNFLGLGCRLISRQWYYYID